MKRVFDNFVENSLKYAHAEPLIMKITLEKEQDDSLTIAFCDNGVGVPPAKLPHLFEQFYREMRLAAMERAADLVSTSVNISSKRTAASLGRRISADCI